MALSCFKYFKFKGNQIFDQFLWTKDADDMIVEHVRNREDRAVTWITGPGRAGKSTWVLHHAKHNAAALISLTSKSDFENLVVRYLG